MQANIEDMYPLSHLQQGVLFHTLYDSRSGVYFEQIAVTMRQKLNKPAFEAAWQSVVDRHSILRTAFVWENLKQPMQVVHRKVKLPLQQMEWSGLTTEDQESRLEEYLKAERWQGFQLSKAPLMKLTLIHIDEDAYYFIWSHHHILLDGWCLPLLMQEFGAFYQACLEGKKMEMERPRPYREYIGWLQQQDLGKAEEYWRRRLGGFEGARGLPEERQRQGELSTEASHGEQQVRIGEETSLRLQRMAREQQVTLNTVMQGAWGMLLSRYSGEEEVIFGATVSGRPAGLAGVETMVGVFINTLPVRVRVSGEAVVREWLKELQEEQLEMRDYEYSPLVEVQKWSETKGGLFESIVVYENYPVGKSRGGGENEGIEIGEVRTFQRTNYPVSVVIGPGKRIVVQVYYDRGQVTDEMIGQVLRHFEQLLTGIARGAEGRLKEITMLGEGEREQVLGEWNQTAAAYPGEQSIAELFEEQVERQEEAVAVVYGAEQVSYGELNRRANQLGHYLREMGVGAEVRVGICMERSVAMVVGLLGILKAGGVYVPLDASYPAERLGYMVADAGVAVVLTQESLAGVLSGEQVRVVSLDGEWERLSGQSELNLASEVRGENLAYVSYTSGSTGKAKGVCITHRAVNRLVCNTNYVSLRPGEKIAQVANSSFDAITFEIWGALLQGGEVRGMSQAAAMGAGEFAEQVGKQEISVMFLTTALFNQVAAEAPWAFKGVGQLLFGGEAVEPKRVAEVLEAGGPGRLLHVYGPTESTTFATWHLVEKEGEARRTIPIGKAISNTEVYLLDVEMEPVPVGVAGEIYLGGAGLGRGYLNEPGLTAEKFVPHGFSGEAGARLYRTGDRGRYSGAGDIEFLGRVDEQVKIRGHRIEPGEVEGVLCGHEEIGGAVVVVREQEIGGSVSKGLVAYVVGKGEATPELKELQEYLRSKLPEYMVPAVIVLLESLPLNASGKVDRRALVEAAAEINRTGYVAPRTATEEIVAGIYAEVLGLERVGAEDDFFEMGGHSLLATQVISRVRQAFEIEAPLRMLFEQPRVGEFAEQIEQAKGSGESLRLPAIVRAERGGKLPLSYAQQRLWFIDQFEPNSALYNIPLGLRLEGELRLEALQQSLSEIVNRHEAFRTRFPQKEGQPVQEVMETQTMPLQLVDLSALPAEAGAEAAQRIGRAEAEGPFDLAAGPLWRARLLRLNEQEHVLLLTMHHIISDGWSMGVLLGELATLYTAFGAGIDSPLSQLPIQYADYAVWQRESLQGAVLEQHVSYWKKQLGQAPTVLELPHDGPRPAVQNSRGSNQMFLVDADVTDGLKRLTRQEHVTLFMTLLAAFKTLLYRYTGAEDISVGTPIANRNRREIEGLIGFFVNTLVLRSELHGEWTFRELLKRVRETAIEAYEHQDMPFEKLVEELQPERDLSRTPLFQVMFVLQNAPAKAFELPGLKIGSLMVQETKAKFDLTLNLIESGTGLIGAIEYNTDLFRAETVERMIEHFTILLTSIAANQGQQLAELPMLSDAERHQLLVGWNATVADYPRNHSLAQLFEEQAAQSPEAVAVVCGAEQVSYGELNRRANQLAYYLRAKGVSAEVRVGICLPRGIQMVVGLLGIFKAGGAYVPLDPGNPKERLAYIIEDAQIGLLLTDNTLLSGLPESSNKAVCLDSEWELILEESAENPQPQSMPDNLAVVFYTSGSTGMPKGVLLQAGGFQNLMHWFAGECLPTSKPRMLLMTPFSFDASFKIIMTPLLMGGVLIVAGADLYDARELLTTIETQQITTIFVTPSLLYSLLDLAQINDYQSLSSLKSIFFGGESTDVLKLRLWANSQNCNCEFIHIYGPSECSDVTTRYKLSRDEIAGLNDLPLGVPISNVQLHVLDRSLNLCPVGVIGELHVSGFVLARGYWNRPELTAEKFIPNPFGQKDRLFKTGDRVKRLASGDLLYLGRVDHQVKIRGIRIEPGEIEAVLNQCPTVKDCVVVAQSNVSGDKRLLAYVVIEEEKQLEVLELRSYLRQKLPDYMVPSAFIRIAALPVTPNGKVDRRALPLPEWNKSRGEMEYVAPRNSEEEILAGIWADVLGIEQVGIHDNFFDLGGHSLLIVQIASRVQETLKVELQLRQVFEAPTVAGLAEIIAIVRRTEQGVQVPPIIPVSRDQDLPLSFGQQRLWFLEQLIPGLSTYNCPGSIRLSGPLSIVALQQALNEVVSRHETLRTAFPAINGRPVQLISPVSTLELACVDLGELSKADRNMVGQQLAIAEAARPFDMAAGPLVRFSLLRLESEEHMLLITVHHIITDGWSMAILFIELATLYYSFRVGAASPLPELPVQYADFSLWQREWLQGEVLDKQLDYWRQQLDGAPPVLKLPTDRPRLAAQGYHGANESLILSSTVYESLQVLSRRAGVTLFMTFLAAFMTVLHRYTGQDDLVVGAPAANRNRLEVEGLIGCFINMLVLRTNLSGNPTFQEFLKQVREVTLGAMAHQDLPFDKLVEDLQPKRNLSHTPLFQVVFQLQNPVPEVSTPSALKAAAGDLKMQPLLIEDNAARFDLSLEIAARAQGPTAIFEYNTDLFDASTIAHMLGSFGTLLQQIVLNPEQRVLDIPLEDVEEITAPVALPLQADFANDEFVFQ